MVIGYGVTVCCTTWHYCSLGNFALNIICEGKACNRILIFHIPNSKRSFFCLNWVQRRRQQQKQYRKCNKIQTPPITLSDEWADRHTYQTARQTDKRTDEPKQTICSARPLKIMPPRVKWLKYSRLQCVHPAYQFQTNRKTLKRLY